MVKGCQRRIILLRGMASGMFEEAYFILKPEKARVPEELMIAEANRIIAEHANQPKKRRSNLLPFFTGLGLGSGWIGLLWLLVG